MLKIYAIFCVVITTNLLVAAVAMKNPDIGIGAALFFLAGIVGIALAIKSGD